MICSVDLVAHASKKHGSAEVVTICILRSDMQAFQLRAGSNPVRCSAPVVQLVEHYTCNVEERSTPLLKW
ncbi:MAG TPA: hypothetical protein VFZ47_09825 [Chitinophagaceae bacterium]